MSCLPPTAHETRDSRFPSLNNRWIGRKARGAWGFGNEARGGGLARGNEIRERSNAPASCLRPVGDWSPPRGGIAPPGFRGGGAQVLRCLSHDDPRPWPYLGKDVGPRGSRLEQDGLRPSRRRR